MQSVHLRAVFVQRLMPLPQHQVIMLSEVIIVCLPFKWDDWAGALCNHFKCDWMPSRFQILFQQRFSIDHSSIQLAAEVFNPPDVLPLIPIENKSCNIERCVIAWCIEVLLFTCINRLALEICESSFDHAWPPMRASTWLISSAYGMLCQSGR